MHTSSAVCLFFLSRMTVANCCYTVTVVVDVAASRTATQATNQSPLLSCNELMIALLSFKRKEYSAVLFVCLERTRNLTAPKSVNCKFTRRYLNANFPDAHGLSKARAIEILTNNSPFTNDHEAAWLGANIRFSPFTSPTSNCVVSST